MGKIDNKLKENILFLWVSNLILSFAISFRWW